MRDHMEVNWPLWLTLIFEQLHRIERKIDLMTQEVDDLQAAVATLTANVAAEADAITASNAEIQSLISELADASANEDHDAVEALVAKINTASQAIADGTESLKAGVAAVPAPATTGTAQAAPETPVVQPNGNLAPLSSTQDATDTSSFGPTGNQAPSDADTADAKVADDPNAPVTAAQVNTPVGEISKNG